MKKILSLFIVCLLVISFLPPKKVSANVVVKAVAGESIENALEGIADKAGFYYGTQNALDMSRDRWNYQWNYLDDINDLDIQARYDSWKNDISKTPEPIPEKPGYGKLVIRAATFVTGLDILYDTYQAYKKAELAGEGVVRQVAHDYAIQSGEAFTSLYDLQIIERPFSHYTGNYVKVEAINTRDYDVVNDSIKTSQPWLADHYVDFGSDYIVSMGKGSQVEQTIGGVPHVGYGVNMFIDYINKNGEWVDSVTSTYVYVTDSELPNISHDVPFIPTADDLPIVDSTRLPTQYEDILLNETKQNHQVEQGFIETIPNFDPDKLVEVVVPLETTAPSPTPYNEPLTTNDLETDPNAPAPESEPVSTTTTQDVTITDPNFFESLWTGLTNLFVPAEPIGPMFDPIINGYKDKFNTPNDFVFLEGAFQTGTCENLKDIHFTMFGLNLQGLETQYLCEWAPWWKPIVSGFMWFMFGWWAFRKMNQLASKNGGVGW